MRAFAFVLLFAPACRAQPAPLPSCEWCGASEAPGGLTAVARIAPPDAAGDRLVLEGRVLHPEGRAAANVLVYFYGTDAAGRYPPGPRPSGNERRHGRLRGWLRTDAAGRYRIETVRPGPYPGRPDPAHVHVTLTPPGGEERYLDDFTFEGDPRLTPAYRARLEGRGGSGIVRLTRTPDGTWHGRRDLLLSP